MLVSLEQAQAKIESGLNLFVAADEALLQQLPKGNWIGGTIPYFMDVEGGVTSRKQVFIKEAPASAQVKSCNWYSSEQLAQVPSDSAANGFSVVIMPASSDVHSVFAKTAEHIPNMLMQPLIGWVSGMHLDDLGSKSAKVFDGFSGKSSSTEAVVLHMQLPEDQIAHIGTVNLFKQGSGDVLTFAEDGVSYSSCFVNGEEQNFAEYIANKKIDITHPLVSNSSGASINVSFVGVNEENKNVDFYAPIFAGVEYKVAEPVIDYVKQFAEAVPDAIDNLAFSCNCVLNYLYSELEGKRSGLPGPATFGEIAGVLMNQTMVYLNIQQR